MQIFFTHNTQQLSKTSPSVSLSSFHFKLSLLIKPHDVLYFFFPCSISIFFPCSFSIIYSSVISSKLEVMTFFFSFFFFSIPIIYSSVLFSKLGVMQTFPTQYINDSRMLFPPPSTISMSDSHLKVLVLLIET